VKTRILAAIVICACLALVAGCGGKAADPAFARKVVDAVYAGSLSPLRDSMTADMQTTSDAIIAQQGAALQRTYGAVKDLKLKSASVVQGFDEQIWTITAERGSYDMRLMFAKDGKLAGVWF